MRWTTMCFQLFIAIDKPPSTQVLKQQQLLTFSQNSVGDWAQLRSSVPDDVFWGCSYLEIQLGWNVQDGSLTWLAVGTGRWMESQLGLLAIVRQHKLSSTWPLLTAWCSSSMMASFWKGVFPGYKVADCLSPASEVIQHHFYLILLTK